MRGDGSAKDWRELSREVCDVRAAPAPERPAIGDGVEGEHLLHAAIAIGRDDEDEPIRQPNDDVVMELSLCPMIEQLVAAASDTELFKERSEDERISEVLEIRVHRREA